MTVTRVPAGMRMTELDRRMVLKLLGAGAGTAALSGKAIARAAQSGIPAAPGGTALRHQIAAYVAAARFEDLPPAVIEKAKEQIVFFFGRAFTSALTQRGRDALEFARQIRGLSTDARVIGDRVRLAPADAALVNASLFSESLPLPALLNEAVHPGVITLPAALAVGEIRRVSGRELLLALVLGYEVLGKLGQSMPSTCRATSIVAGYAATAAAGRLFGLDREHMIRALEHATHPCIDVEQNAVAELYPGLISRNGIFAAHLAQAGAHPNAHEVSEDEPRACRSPFDDAAAELPDSIDDLGYWEILTTLQRPYRSTGHYTAAVELLAHLMQTHQLTERSVSAIQVALPASGSRALDMELAARGPFKPACSACSSVPYSLARVLADGRVDTARFADDRLVSDPLVLRLMQTIDVAFENGHGPRWARITVHTHDGRTLERASDFFTCELPPDMWHDWLRASGKRLLPAGQLLELTRVIRDLDNVDDVSKLLAAATSVQAGARA